MIGKWSRADKHKRREVSDYARQELISGLKAKGIRDKRVLNAMLNVPRHRFIEEEYVNLAYQDRSLPIGHQQTISQPYIVAYMTEVLIQNDPDSVLEIGTGSGYQAAVLAQLVARVFTVERISNLYRNTRHLLKELGYRNIHFRCSDGHRGWQQFAPYDAIIVTAAAATVPKLLLTQLADSGRLVIPLNQASDKQVLTLVTPCANGFQTQSLCGVKFVPLV